MIGSNHRKSAASRTRRASPRGFALLIAIVLSAVAAAVTVSLTTLAYKGLLLSSAARESQYAFYAADTATECALYWDNAAHTAFAFTTTPGTVPINCAGTAVSLTGTYDASNHRDKFVVSTGGGWFTVDGSDCARITVYKYDPLAMVVPSTQIFGDGANTSCATLSTNPRAVERGLKALY